MEGRQKRLCIKGHSLLEFSDDVLVILIGWLAVGNGKLQLLCTCKKMHSLVLTVFPPWDDNGKGLRWAVQEGYIQYYRQWATPEKWIPDLALLKSALDGLARHDWQFMFSLLEDERVDPMPILCDPNYNGRNELELFVEVVRRGKTVRLDRSAFLDWFTTTYSKTTWFAKAQLYSQLMTDNHPVIACTAASRVGDWDTLIRMARTNSRNVSATALEHVVLHANREVVQILLQMDGLHWPDSLLAITERADIFQLLLPRLNPAADNNDGFRSAVAHDRISIVKLLLADGRADPSEAFLAGWNVRYCPTWKMMGVLLSDPRVDPSIRESRALQLTLRRRRGQTRARERVALMLLKDGRCDPSVRDNIAIRNAAWLGYANVVEALLKDPRVDPRAGDNEAIVNATKRGHTQIVDMLKSFQ